MQRFPSHRLLAAVVALAAFFPSSSLPDEGMWPFDGLPRQQLKDKYGFEPTKEWLDHVRLGSVRFDTGGSGSFVSANGLVMTNHHVALSTIQQVSTEEKDWVKDGFSARLYGSELKSKGLTLRQLIDVRDVTEEILAARAADESEEGNEWREKFAQMCDAITDEAKHIQADPVRLYNDQSFRIYVYHTYDDVRVVFAPEKQIAFFGGDLDNFTYPRYDLDCAFFRVYEDDKPIDSSKYYFKWNSGGAKVDELVFVSGHPGSTQRLLTYAELEFLRDVRMPQQVSGLRQMHDMLEKQMATSEQAAFRLREQFFGIANALKAFEGQLGGLQDDAMMAQMKARDDELIDKSGEAEVQAAFDAIAAGYAAYRELIDAEQPREELQAFRQRLDGEITPPAKAVINKARFDVYGNSMYPDATFTLRLAYGTVKGYESGTTLVPPKTTFYGLYERNAAFNNEAPFDLPEHWLTKRDKLNLATPYNFVCTADIIGGNSGSPVLNRDAEVVGLVFDGNIESLPGNYWFDERINRCVSVHTGGMLEAIDKIYGEKDLVGELTGGE